MSYAFETPHPYVDLSKRKPYTCGVCLRDIRHPIHQLSIPGTDPVTTARREEPAEVETPRRVERSQHSFTF